MTATHVPVLLHETVDLLAPPRGGVAVDCTFGAGGHARAIAERLGPDGLLIAIDRDPDAEARFDEFTAEVACATRFVRADFVEGLAMLADEDVRADALLMDLGMSSMQVDTRERGFSYVYDAPLDMRMDPTLELSAREVVNEWDERDLSRALRDLGEERYARQIARGIVRARARGSIDTTTELVDVITAAVPAPARFADGHPARGPRPGAVRGRASGQAHLPGDPDRRQRRARTARLGAAPRVARARHRRPICRDFLPQPGRPAREALPGRPRTRVHLPARPPGVRVRRRAARGAAQPPVDRRRIGRGRRELAGRLGAAARRPQAEGHGMSVGRASVLGSLSLRKD